MVNPDVLPHRKNLPKPPNLQQVRHEILDGIEQALKTLLVQSDDKSQQEKPKAKSQEKPKAKEQESKDDEKQMHGQIEKEKDLIVIE